MVIRINSKLKRIDTDLSNALDRLADYEAQIIGYKVPKRFVHQKLARKLNKFIDRRDTNTVIDWFK